MKLNWCWVSPPTARSLHGNLRHLQRRLTHWVRLNSPSMTSMTGRIPSLRLPRASGAPHLVFRRSMCPRLPLRVVKQPLSGSDCGASSVACHAVKRHRLRRHRSHLRVHAHVIASPCARWGGRGGLQWCSCSRTLAYLFVPAPFHGALAQPVRDCILNSFCFGASLCLRFHHTCMWFHRASFVHCVWA